LSVTPSSGISLRQASAFVSQAFVMHQPSSVRPSSVISLRQAGLHLSGLRHALAFVSHAFLRHQPSSIRPLSGNRPLLGINLHQASCLH
jgi:hypothetical protein